MSVLETRPKDVAQLRLGPKQKMESMFHPGSGPESAQNPQFPLEDGTPEPPRTPGGRWDKNKIKSVLKYREVSVDRNTATETQTQNKARGVEKQAGNPRKTAKNLEHLGTLPPT